ncbi:haloacid dehalogenase-like hydrolase-domain-containing protein [Lactarius sanguifluus]|nr:haloacid dehalogenase-like hydrolase-domain-containing protein [Lactarius sanguifluus]
MVLHPTLSWAPSLPLAGRSSKSTASPQASKEIYNLFVRTLIFFILCIPVLVLSLIRSYIAPSLFLATGIQICAGRSSVFYGMPCSCSTNSTLMPSSYFPLQSHTFSPSSPMWYRSRGHEFNTPFFETPALSSPSASSSGPDYVQLVSSDGPVTVIHADLTQSNDILRVSANTLVPTDGIVIGGMTQVDESALTGESLPVDKGAENTITEISALVARLQEAQFSIQDLADRAASWLGPVILVVAIIVFVVWIIGLRTAIATQCVKDTTVAMFDKTSYLMLGEMAVVEAHITRQGRYCRLVSKSSHPVARFIAKYLHATYPHCEDLSLDKVQSILGKGLEVTTSDGVLIRGGSRSWLGLQTDPLWPGVLHNDDEGSVDVRCHVRRLIGWFFELTDLPRSSAGAAVQLLQAQGIQVHIISGDAAPVVHPLASQLGVPPELAHGGCLPAEKVAHVQELQASGGRVVFGDGTNDTPALAAGTRRTSCSSRLT